MSYQFLKSLNSREILIKNKITGKTFSLMNPFSSWCSFCYYPTKEKDPSECHIGLSDIINRVSYVMGYYYETDYQGNPLNWYGKLLKNISTQPFKESHELLSLILFKNITKSTWNPKSIHAATMIPTTNQQMYELFLQLSKSLNIIWIHPDNLFIRNEVTQSYKNRQEYVNLKYSLKYNAESFIPSNVKHMLIFDDVLNQGFTFSRIIFLLKQVGIEKFFLASLARTTPKTFVKSFSFP